MQIHMYYNRKMINSGGLVNYLPLNKCYKSPLVYKLTQRGFFSEVNNLINAVLYCLVMKRRLIVDQSDFGGMTWSDFFSADLPDLDSDSYEVDHEWQITGPKHPGFKRINRKIKAWHNFKIPIMISKTGFIGSVFMAKKLIASFLCSPKKIFDDQLNIKEPYAAIHVRRGDKLGYYNNDRLLIEGDDIPPEKYLSMLDAKAPNLNVLFVMTDDHNILDQLIELAPNLKIKSLCTQGENGYYQEQFNSLDKDYRYKAIGKLVLETEIASNSELFIGCYKSNVSRYIATRHKNFSNCYSIDRQTRWHPN